MATIRMMWREKGGGMRKEEAFDDHFGLAKYFDNYPAPIRLGLKQDDGKILIGTDAYNVLKATGFGSNFPTLTPLPLKYLTIGESVWKLYGEGPGQSIPTPNPVVYIARIKNRPDWEQTLYFLNFDDIGDKAGWDLLNVYDYHLYGQGETYETEINPAWTAAMAAREQERAAFKAIIQGKLVLMGRYIFPGMPVPVTGDQLQFEWYRFADGKWNEIPVRSEHWLAVQVTKKSDGSYSIPPFKYLFKTVPEGKYLSMWDVFTEKAIIKTTRTAKIKALFT